MPKTSGHYKFRRDDNVGSVDAENDRYLDACFVDRGDVDVLLDCNHPHCIVVGRTGSGKSALLLEVQKRQPMHTLCIRPESLSLNYIANSDVVTVLSKLGVNLDPFFKLLWRHVLAVHVFQHLRPVTEGEQNGGLLAWASRLIRNDKTNEEKAARHQRVLEFLDKHSGQPFWGDVGSRVKEIVYKFEREFERQTGKKSESLASVKFGGVEVSADQSDRGSQREGQSVATEVIVQQRQRFQNVVNEMQVRELDGILDLMREVLEDAGQNVYVVIDKLDLQWADESVRFRLIRALVDTAIAFTGVRRAKVILAMRIDLIERVYRDARHEPGTQFEKVKDHCRILAWDRGTLIQMIDERLSKLVSDQYSASYKVTMRDVVNPKIRKGRQKGVATVDFILDRTWNRPRDTIDFLNECIKRSTGSPKISDDALLDAEGDYSRSRVRSLSEEWQLEYPFLEETLRKLLSGRARRFHLVDVADEQLCDWSDMVLKQPERDGDRIRPLAIAFDKDTNGNELRVQLAAVMYKVGSVGVQTDEAEKPHWASNFGYSLSADEINQKAMIYIHAALWKAFGIL